MKYTKSYIKDAIETKLKQNFGLSPSESGPEQFLRASALVMRDELAARLAATRTEIKEQHKKKVHYLSMEFLVGRSLLNNAYNLGILEPLKEALKEYGINIQDVLEKEPDPGLGNGGLGRLAACYMDAMASLEIPATGYSIRYKHGVFKQRIIDGVQVELPDSWLDIGNDFMIPRISRTQEVRFGGTVKEFWEDGKLRIEHTGYTSVLAVPYDLPISGYHTNNVTSLRLWDAKSPVDLDMKLFSQGEYLKAVEQNALAQVISMVLYPEDNHPEGQSLRLKQQYFFVSATIQYLVQRHKETYGTMANFAEKNVIQINDTHPSLAIPELMRILLDEEGMGWDEAWNIVTSCMAYTNHTVMSEALERWSVGLFELLLPRITMIIKEINERFCRSLWTKYEGDFQKISDMAIVSGCEIRMANLAIVGSFSVNGVSTLHGKILKERVFKDFNDVYPDKFSSITNGITHRRWLCQANPLLSDYISSLIGKGFVENAEELRKLEKFADDKAVLDKIAEIKLANKERLAKYILEKNHIIVNPDSVFDVQAKRLHEYKRQLLNVMQIIDRYFEIKDNPNKEFLPKTYIFAAKASSGYKVAKEIIRFIIAVADKINNDKSIRDLIKIVFLEDYKVSLAEILMPAAEISEQISTAGKEASGTGNMKFMINGALTIGTLDGANVEMSEAVGMENMFIFGLRANEVEDLKASGIYNPSSIYNNDKRIKRIIDFFSDGFPVGHNFKDLAALLTLHGDQYLLLADFNSYKDMCNFTDEVYKDKYRWNKMSLANIAAAGTFSADGSVANYANKIWNIPILRKK